MSIELYNKTVQRLANSQSPFQLAKHYDEVPDKYHTFPTWVEIKYDGVFCGVVSSGDGSLTYLSRTGKKFWRELNLYQHCPSEAGVWIGEILNTECSLEVLSGLINPNRVNEWTTEERKIMRSAKIVFHDALTLDEAAKGSSAVGYAARRKRHPWGSYVAEGTVVHNEEDMHSYANTMIGQGHEGIVRKDIEAGWVAGHKGWRVQKIVRDLHIDLRCVAIDTGKGKRFGQIARMQFVYKGKLFWADLGKGWTDEKRIELTKNWQQQNEGDPTYRVFHIKALQESSKGVLRLPKVMEMRIDKDVEDVT